MNIIPASLLRLAVLAVAMLAGFGTFAAGQHTPSSNYLQAWVGARVIDADARAKN